MCVAADHVLCSRFSSTEISVASGAVGKLIIISPESAQDAVGHHRYLHHYRYAGVALGFVEFQ